MAIPLPTDAVIDYLSITLNHPQAHLQTPHHPRPALHNQEVSTADRERDC